MAYVEVRGQFGESVFSSYPVFEASCLVSAWRLPQAFGWFSYLHIPILTWVSCCHRHELWRSRSDRRQTPVAKAFFTCYPQVSFCFLFFLSLSGSKARRVSAALCLCWYLMSLVFGCFVCLGIGSHPVAPGRPKAAVCGDGPRWWRLLMCLLFILIWSLMKYLYRSVAHLQNRAIFLLSFKSSVFYVTVFCKINVFWKLLLKVMTYLFIL